MKKDSSNPIDFIFQVIFVRGFLKCVKDLVSVRHFCELAELNPRKAMIQSLSYVECWVSVSKTVTIIEEVINLLSYLLLSQLFVPLRIQPVSHRSSSMVLLMNNEMASISFSTGPNFILNLLLIAVTLL